jgi:hypothetical protein
MGLLETLLSAAEPVFSFVSAYWIHIIVFGLIGAVIVFLYIWGVIRI